MSSILDKEHPDITYLKQDEIGLVLSKGLSETYKVQPKYPVEFFAKWLLNYSKTQQEAVRVSNRIFYLGSKCITDMVGRIRTEKNK